MAKKTKATSAEEKLRALYDIQLIDSRIDRLRVVRGELPLEVEDLEDELAGLTSRLERLTEESDGIKRKIQERKEAIIEALAAQRFTTGAQLTQFVYSMHLGRVVSTVAVERRRHWRGSGAVRSVAV